MIWFNITFLNLELTYLGTFSVTVRKQPESRVIVMKQKLECNNNMAPSTPHDLYKIIMSLKNTSSSGFDGIATKVEISVSRDMWSSKSHN